MEIGLKTRLIESSYSPPSKYSSPTRESINQGAYIPGGERRSQSADRCVMRQRTGASVFFEQIRKERDFVALSLCGFYFGFMSSFKKFLTWSFETMFPLHLRAFLG